MQISADTVIIITGSARGFGKTLIDEYAPKEAKIYGTYVSSKEAAQKIMRKYSNVKMYKVDNTNPSEIKKFINKIVRMEKKIDILINNAGNIQERKKIVDLSLKNFQELLNVHVVGTFVYCKCVLPYMLENNSGVIINIASRFGLFEWAKEGFGALNVAKAGVNMLTKVLFQELKGTGIRVNSILPAPTVTNFLSTVFTPEEINAMKEKGVLGEKHEFVAQVNKVIGNENLNGEFIISERLK